MMFLLSNEPVHHLTHLQPSREVSPPKEEKEKEVTSVEGVEEKKIEQPTHNSEGPSQLEDNSVDLPVYEHILQEHLSETSSEDSLDKMEKSEDTASTIAGLSKIVQSLMNQFEKSKKADLNQQQQQQQQHDETTLKRRQKKKDASVDLVVAENKHLPLKKRKIPEEFTTSAKLPKKDLPGKSVGASTSSNSEPSVKRKTKQPGAILTQGQLFRLSKSIDTFKRELDKARDKKKS